MSNECALGVSRNECRRYLTVMITPTTNEQSLVCFVYILSTKVSSDEFRRLIHGWYYDWDSTEVPKGGKR